MDELKYLPDTFPDRTELDSIGAILGIAVNVAMGVGVSVSVVFLGLAGLRFISAGGDPKAVDQAKKALTYAVVALVLSVGALAFKTILVGGILGVTESDLTDPVPDF
jgi:hypothetical protein